MPRRHSECPLAQVVISSGMLSIQLSEVKNSRVSRKGLLEQFPRNGSRQKKIPQQRSPLSATPRLVARASLRQQTCLVGAFFQARRSALFQTYEEPAPTQLLFSVSPPPLQFRWPTFALMLLRAPRYPSE